MRLIGTLENKDEARRFTAYLKKKGIDVNCEASFDIQTNHPAYHLWIRDEDQIDSAAHDLARFLKQPSHSEFDGAALSPLPTQPLPAATAASGAPHIAIGKISTPVTHFFIALCICIFFLDWFQEQRIYLNNPVAGNVLMTPLEETFFFDLPADIDEVGKAIEGKNFKTFPEDAQAEEKALQQLSYWHGAYDWLLNRLKGTPTLSGPLFYRIGQGELWRLFTPALLHGGFLHILFNMLWLWVLGLPVEKRLGFMRTLFLTLLLGCGSNVCQYLMGGPFFLGYSGIVVGLAGFIWSREKVAPWEGYPLQKSTIFFLLLFVLGVFTLQCVSFFLQLFTSFHFSPNIANTGHISGGLIGMALGRLRLFARGKK